MPSFDIGTFDPGSHAQAYNFREQGHNLGSIVSDPGVGYISAGPQQGFFEQPGVKEILGPSSVELHNGLDSTGNLHPSYLGKNLFLRDTINQAILQKNSFYFQQLLPIQQTDQINVQWNVLQLDNLKTALETSLPSQGVSKVRILRFWPTHGLRVKAGLWLRRS